MPTKATSHTSNTQLGTDKGRGNASARGYDHRWRKVRADYLKANPLCVECQKNGTLTPATAVDHIEPHRGDEGLFWCRSNWQSLCQPCHNRKTARGL